MSLLGGLRTHLHVLSELFLLLSELFQLGFALSKDALLIGLGHLVDLVNLGHGGSSLGLLLLLDGSKAGLLLSGSSLLDIGRGNGSVPNDLCVGPLGINSLLSSSGLNLFLLSQLFLPIENSLSGELSSLLHLLATLFSSLLSISLLLSSCSHSLLASFSLLTGASLLCLLSGVFSLKSFPFHP